MTPLPSDKREIETREAIDQKLIAAGWIVQDKKRLNLHASLGVAVREMDTDTGPADYMLFIGGRACGILEAKREGSNLGDVVNRADVMLSHAPSISNAGQTNCRLPMKPPIMKSVFATGARPMPVPAMYYSIFTARRPCMNGCRRKIR